MAIGKVRLVSTNDTPGVQSTRGKPLSGDCIPAETAPAAEEGLRLIQAFARIKDPGQRAKLIETAEDLAVARQLRQLPGRAARAGAADDSDATRNGLRR
jgi:hypothetical protein